MTNAAYLRKHHGAAMRATSQPDSWPAIVLALIAIIFATAAVVLVVYSAPQPDCHQPPAGRIEVSHPATIRVLAFSYEAS